MKPEVCFDFRHKSSITGMNTANTAMNHYHLHATCTADSVALTNMNVSNEVISDSWHAESRNQLNQMGMRLGMTKCNFTVLLWWHFSSPAGPRLKRDMFI
jgi:hypothetical protein